MLLNITQWTFKSSTLSWSYRDSIYTNSWFQYFKSRCFSASSLILLSCFWIIHHILLTLLNNLSKDRIFLCAQNRHNRYKRRNSLYQSIINSECRAVVLCLSFSLTLKSTLCQFLLSPVDGAIRDGRLKCTSALISLLASAHGWEKWSQQGTVNPNTVIFISQPPWTEIPVSSRQQWGNSPDPATWKRDSTPNVCTSLKFKQWFFSTGLCSVVPILTVLHRCTPYISVPPDLFS